MATTYQWMGLTAETVGVPVVAAGIEEIEIDPQVASPRRQKTKRWILQALDGHSGRTAGLSLVVMGQG